MARDDRRDVQAAQALESRQATGDRAHHDKRCSAVEEEVTRKQDALLRHPGRDVVSRMSRPHRDELEAGIVDVDVEAVLESDERRHDFYAPPFNAGKEFPGL